MVADTVAPWAETVLFTADDLARLPDDGWQYELVEGRLVRMPPPGAAHGRVCSALNALLHNFVVERNLGIVLSNDSGFIIGRPGRADTVLGPDVAFISIKTLVPEAVDAEQGYLQLAPDLVVEVVSPSQTRPEIAAKCRRWLDAGVSLVWLVWPVQRQIDVWDARDPDRPTTFRVGDELQGGDVLPGFTLPLDLLWR